MKINCENIQQDYNNKSLQRKIKGNAFYEKDALIPVETREWHKTISSSISIFNEFRSPNFVNCSAYRMF